MMNNYDNFFFPRNDENEQLKKVVSELYAALKNLYNEQDGPPNPKRVAEWESAMDTAYKLVVKYDSFK